MIHCKYDALIPVADLKPHPKNRNKHSTEQIDRLSRLILYQGVRAPIIVSKLSGFIVKGHGTCLAMELAKILEAPVVYQDFDNEEQEYAFVQSDNAIASWAELDLSGINTDIPELGPEFDLDMLGIKDFLIDPIDKFNEPSEKKDPEFKEPELKTCPNCGVLIEANG